MMDSFESGKAASRLLSGIKLARCMLEYALDEQTEFFANVAHNRALRVGVSTDKQASLKRLGVLPSQGEG